MRKIFLFSFLLSYLFSLAQNTEALDTIHLSIKSPNTKRVILYSAEGATQKYISYSDAEDGIFDLVLPHDSHHGMYRLLYNQKTMDYVDCLYTGNSFSISFDSNKPLELPVFDKSEDNQNYYKALDRFGVVQAHLDSLQVAYFKVQDSLHIAKIKAQYTDAFNQFKQDFETFTQTEASDLVKDLVIANVRVQPQVPIKDPVAYLPYIKAHYFDRVDFNNTNLIFSSILIDKVMDYVFYLTVARDETTQNNLYKKSISDVMQKIDNQELKSGFIKALIQSYAKDENIVMTDFLLESYYNKLPKAYQNDKFVLGLQQDLKTAVGRMAEDFSWKENGKAKSLYQLNDYTYYILVFWSSSCPHCLKEIPKLHEYIKEKKDYKVIAVGMETEESKEKWKAETYYYPGFSHVLGLGKWENPIARHYNVYATPTYFILNANKKIISKPYEFIDLKEFFDKKETGE